MAALSLDELERIKRDVEKEFPFDPALQQVHMARKIITKEAEKKGLDFFDYIRSRDKQPKKSH